MAFDFEELMTNVDDHVFRAACNNYLGWCTMCEDFTRPHTEPDAEDYECPICGNASVVGAEQALLLGEVEIT